MALVFNTINNVGNQANKTLKKGFAMLKNLVLNGNKLVDGHIVANTYGGNSTQIYGSVISRSNDGKILLFMPINNQPFTKIGGKQVLGVGATKDKDGKPYYGIKEKQDAIVIDLSNPDTADDFQAIADMVKDACLMYRTGQFDPALAMVEPTGIESAVVYPTEQTEVKTKAKVKVTGKGRVKVS